MENSQKPDVSKKSGRSISNRFRNDKHSGDVTTTEESQDAQSWDLDADMFDEDKRRLYVGEQLFTEICEGWIEANGLKVLEKILESRTMGTTSKKQNNRRVGSGDTPKK